MSRTSAALATLLCTALVLCVSARAAGHAVWWLDVLNNAPQLAVGAAVLLALLLADLGAWSAADITLWVGATFLPAPVTTIRTSSDGTTGTTVLLTNVDIHNPDLGPLLALIHAEDPDIIGLLEVDERKLAALDGLDATYPCHRAVPRSDSFGVALWSRDADCTLTTELLGDPELPSLRLEQDGTTYWLTHTRPPRNHQDAAARDAHLQAIAALLAEPHTVVLGDLNATPYSAHFPQPGAAALPTWPSGLPAVARLSLDHVLSSDDVALRGLRVGAAVGSDHRPVLAEVVGGAAW